MPPPASSHRETRHSAIHFLASYVWRLWDRSQTLFYCLCVQPSLLASTAVRDLSARLVESGVSPAVSTVCPATFRRWIATDTFYLPALSQRLLMQGQWCASPIHKGYYGKPTHHIGVSNLYRLLISKMLNPQPIQRPGRSGPNYCLPSPRRAITIVRQPSTTAASSYHTKKRLSTYSKK